MVSLVYLALMALACIVGPSLVPNDFTTIHADYTRVPPSISAYPKAEGIEAALKDALRRARLDLVAWKQDGTQIDVTVTSSKAVDPRSVRYLDRSDVFEGTTVSESSADRLTMTMSTQVQQTYFLFGTDSNGRDLLQRTLVAGRVSLAIGLLAGIVAVIIGVLYGASAGLIGGKTDEVMMRIVDILYSLPFIFFVIMLVVFFGRNFVLMFLAVGAVLWLDARWFCAWAGCIVSCGGAARRYSASTCARAIRRAGVSLCGALVLAGRFAEHFLQYRAGIRTGWLGFIWTIATGWRVVD